MNEVALGNFRLECDAQGRLVQLTAGTIGPLLHRTAYRARLDEGRTFEPGGWEECFPTIEAFENSPVMGDLIGLEPREESEPGTYSQTWTTGRFSAERRFRTVTPAHLEVAFSSRNLSPQPLRFLWASHAIFSLEPLRRFALTGGPEFTDFSLDGTSSKTFYPNHGAIRLAYEAGEVSLETDQPWWGIWLNRGGWPAAQPAGLACVGLEATNTAADFPRDARLLPDEQFCARIHLRIL
ncbi:MAG: hypothetical protein WCH98_03355 [Verrucomicrobiota bacterium]